MVARFARRLGLTFPIVNDASYRLVSRFRSEPERPAFYLADASGRVVFEGGGPHTREVDHALRAALAGTRPRDGDPLGVTDGAWPPRARAPDAERIVYLGTSRVAQGPLARAEPGRAEWFTAQFRYQEEGRRFVPYPVGRWTPNAEDLIAARGGPENYVSIRGDGNAWAVLAPPTGGSARVWILGDEAWLAREQSGADVRFDARGGSFVEVTEPRLYAIARCRAGCVLKLSPEVAGTAFYSFAFEPSAAP